MEKRLLTLMLLLLLISQIISQLNAQNLFTITDEERRGMYKVEIESEERRKYPKSYFEDLEGRNLLMVSLVSRDEEFKLDLYTNTSLDLFELDKVKVIKRREQFKYRVLSCLTLGAVGFFAGKHLVNNDRHGDFLRLVGQRSNKIGQSIAGAALGVNIGIALGSFLGEKTFHFNRNKNEELLRFKDYVGK